LNPLLSDAAVLQVLFSGDVMVPRQAKITLRYQKSAILGAKIRLVIVQMLLFLL